MECCDNAGGRVLFHIGNKRYATRGGVTIRPTNFSRESNANDDGSIYVTTKPEPAMAEFTLSDACGLNIRDLTDACFVDVTIDLIDMKKKYLFTKATIVGRPEYKTEDGTISGLKVSASQVKEIPY
jgi:hypothetical protein